MNVKTWFKSKTILFGLFVALLPLAQWSLDLLDVIDGEPDWVKTLIGTIIVLLRFATEGRVTLSSESKRS